MRKKILSRSQLLPMFHSDARMDARPAGLWFHPPRRSLRLLRRELLPTATARQHVGSRARPWQWNNLTDVFAGSGSTSRKPPHGACNFPQSSLTFPQPSTRRHKQASWCARRPLIVSAENCTRARKTSRWCAPTFPDRARPDLRPLRERDPTSLCHRSAAEARRRVRHLTGRIFERDLLLHDRVRAPHHPGSKSGELKNLP